MIKFIIDKNTHMAAFIILLIIVSIKIISTNHLNELNISLLDIECFLLFSFFCNAVILYARKNIIEKYEETKVAINIISIIMVLSLIISYVLYYIGCKSTNKDYQSSITLLISTVLIGSGWWVQAVISKAASKKSHTINTLMSQRNSDIFYKNSKSISEKFGFSKTINEDIARIIIDPDHISVSTKKLKSEYNDAARNVLFILNYYEFICAGIKNNDFDGKLIFDCLSHIIISLEVRYFYFLKISREKDGRECFINIIEIIDLWSPSKSKILNLERGGQLGNISTVFNNDDEFIENTQQE